MTLRNAIKSGHVKRGYKATLGFASTNAPYSGFIYYKSKQWVVPKPNCGPCAVFTEYKDILNIVRHYSKRGIQLWECYFIESKEEFLWTADGHNTSALGCYFGTVLADAVMITKPIKLWYQLLQ